MPASLWNQTLTAAFRRHAAIIQSKRTSDGTGHRARPCSSLFRRGRSSIQLYALTCPNGSPRRCGDTASAEILENRPGMDQSAGIPLFPGSSNRLFVGDDCECLAALLTSQARRARVLPPRAWLSSHYRGAQFEVLRPIAPRQCILRSVWPHWDQSGGLGGLCDNRISLWQLSN